MEAGIERLDLHGMNRHQAKVAIDSRLKKSKAYRIRVIHGHNSGTALQQLVRREYRSHPRILRLELGINPGETDLVLREW